MSVHTNNRALPDLIVFTIIFIIIFQIFTMSKSPGGRDTRTNTDHFLIGQETSNLGKDARQGKLPLTLDVMRYFFHRKNLPVFKFKPVDSAISCPFKAHKHIASCDDNPICRDSSECVVSKVKGEGNWLLSGIPIMGDLAIIKKVKKLNGQYRALDKNKKKPNSNLLKRMEFSEKLDELFDISVPGVENQLEVDRLREEQAREEDIRFLADQRDPDRRKMSVGGKRDLDYDEAVEDKAMRETRNVRMTGKTVIETNNNKQNEDDDIEDDEEVDDDETSDFEVKYKKRKIILSYSP